MILSVVPITVSGTKKAFNKYMLNEETSETGLPEWVAGRNVRQDLWTVITLGDNRFTKPLI